MQIDSLRITALQTTVPQPTHLPITIPWRAVVETFRWATLKEVYLFDLMYHLPAPKDHSHEILEACSTFPATISRMKMTDVISYISAKHLFYCNVMEIPI